MLSYISAYKLKTNGELVSTFQLITQDQLDSMKDEELVNLQNIFRRKLMKARRDSDNNDEEYTSKIEIELNYIFREIEIRELRRKAHLEFMNARANRSKNAS